MARHLYTYNHMPQFLLYKLIVQYQHETWLEKTVILTIWQLQYI